MMPGYTQYILSHSLWFISGPKELGDRGEHKYKQDFQRSSGGEHAPSLHLQKKVIEMDSKANNERDYTACDQCILNGLKPHLL